MSIYKRHCPHKPALALLKIIEENEIRASYKKIVILNESPRKKGNTSALAAEFTRGQKKQDISLRSFFDGMDIHGCKGCFGGHSNRECPCVQKDDMGQIYPAVKECDVIVPASPLYYWNMSVLRHF